MFYFVKTPWYIKKAYPKRIWDVKTKEKEIFLSFDDGPHPVATPFVLEQLKKYNANATFFCIGSNVRNEPALFSKVIEEGHAVGNHTFRHLNGYDTSNYHYMQDILQADKLIHSSLFRPPYGRITSSQAKMLHDRKIVMWDVLSGDFDEELTPEKCLEGVLKNTVAGSIVVFHESDKALDKMLYTLPLVLEHFSLQGFSFRKIAV
jgi:peptidoglycan/xylan/chitin deacetylase (PgdA/CDA1 family)